MKAGVRDNTPAQIRPRVAAGLKERRAELEQALLSRVLEVADPPESPDRRYLQGLRSAISAAIDYGLAGVESGGQDELSVPPALIAQARLAARGGVGLQMVLRRYVAGFALFSLFVLEEIEGTVADGGPLLEVQAALLDAVLAAVSEAHTTESRAVSDAAERQKADLVARLLAGERVEIGRLAYDCEGWHVGLLASGPGAVAAVDRLAKALDRRLLLVSLEEGELWGWLGGSRRVDTGSVVEAAGALWPQGAIIALGESARGVAGWRLTHQEAQAAMRVARRKGVGAVRYADVGLDAAVLRDEILLNSLRRLYLVPLGRARDGGQTARRTLRAYLAANRNVSSAAAALGASRQTVSSRLRAIEEKLGRRLEDCATEIEVALRLDEADDDTHPIDR